MGMVLVLTSHPYWQQGPQRQGPDDRHALKQWVAVQGKTDDRGMDVVCFEDRDHLCSCGSRHIQGQCSCT